MDIRRLLLAAVLLLLSSAVPVLAHHSFSAEFDINKPVTLKGTLTKMEWTNPHGWIYVDVKQPDGQVVNWSVEAGAPKVLIRHGLRKTDFPIGSEITVQGYQSKHDTHAANGISVKFANGRNFFLGASPTDDPTSGAEQ
jgi:Family of unknown function (DUF6152)